MKAVICAVVLAATGVAAAGGETKYGAGVSLTEATAVKALLESPETFVGKTVRVDGVAMAVCEHMGCWLAVAPEGEPAKTVRIQVDHDGVIKFPMTAKGKQVSAQGVFEEVPAKGGHSAATGAHTDHKPSNEKNPAAGDHAAHAGDPAKHDAATAKKYHLKATGVVVR